MDVFLYNGEITRDGSREFIDLVKTKGKHTECVLILVTPGGDPDAAYIIGRYLQRKYGPFKLLVSGMCKSAGTLIAAGAWEIIFGEHGELGPLDIQLTLRDDPSASSSGLDITEAFLALERRSLQTYAQARDKIIQDSDGIMSFISASDAARRITGALYGPIFEGIKASEVGASARAMRIVSHYGERLDAKWNNLEAGALDLLVHTYPDHGFVIDQLEASSLFKRVRFVSDAENQLIVRFGRLALVPEDELTLDALEFNSGNLNQSKPNGKAKDGSRSRSRKNGRYSQAPVEAERPATGGGSHDSDS